MTIAELTRAIESKQRIETKRAKEKASFDYILADLIGRSVARIHSSSNKLPTIAEAYPSLFVAEEKDKLSAIRFKKFASSFNKRLKGGAKKNE